MTFSSLPLQVSYFLEERTEETVTCCDMQLLSLFCHPMSPDYCCLIISLPLGAFPSAGPCIRCCANADLASFFCGHALIPEPRYVIDDGVRAWTWSQYLIAWGLGCTADRCEGSQLCRLLDAWDLTDLKIPGRDPDFRPLLPNTRVYREWDTDCSGFHVCINTNVVIKTVNKTEQVCSTWHMLWLHGGIHSWEPWEFFVPFRLTSYVYLKCYSIVHFSYRFICGCKWKT